MNKKKLISFLLTLALVVGLLPTVVLNHTKADGVESATITLWGTKYTVDAATSFYWTNNGEEAPAESTADNWNYALAIIDGVPTVSVKNADFQYAKRFLYVSRDTSTNAANYYVGPLNLVYEGTNNFIVPNSSSKQFVYISGLVNDDAPNNVGTQFKLIGKEGAKLNITGGYEGTAMFQIDTAQSVTISGGEINIKRTDDANQAVINCYNTTALVENCTLNVTNEFAKDDILPAVTLGGGSPAQTGTIRNSKVTINTTNGIGLCVGVGDKATKTVTDGTANDLIIENSTVDITVNYSQDSIVEAYRGGIYAKNVIVKSGSLQVNTSGVNALNITNAEANGPDLSKYEGNYQMFTAKDGAAVTAYTQTTYFKVEPAAASVTPTEAPTQAPTSATQAPTSATQAPTQAPTSATQAPTSATQAPTQAGNDNPGTGDNGIVLFTTLLFVAVFGVVATVAFSKKNSIVE